MSGKARTVATFPSTRIVPASGGVPVEVTLIAQLGHGVGDQMYASACARQRAHPAFIDALDEPSTQLGGTDFAKGDATALYTFSVGPQGHPFHRHAGHRVFTAVSGSSGAQLRFSTATPDELADDPAQFVRALHHVNVPPDCLFTVRFNGETWHQFAPRDPSGRHPALFALSCHTNELGGELAEATRQHVLAGEASIPLLTELLPEHVVAWLAKAAPRLADVPTVSLALNVRPDSLQSALCKRIRGGLGRLRSFTSQWRRAGGFLSETGTRLPVQPLAKLPDDSLLRSQLADAYQHEDMFQLELSDPALAKKGATRLLSALLDGFLLNPPSSVSRLMALRNTLVRPLGLRTSTLGCPVSSLLSSRVCERFDQRFPVLAQMIDESGHHAQVILGADDKHLRFRSCIGVRIVDGRRIELTLGTRVHCTNLFGHVYIALIERVHRHHVSPAMLRMAAEHAFVHTAARQDLDLRILAT
ncbi:Protein of unknown function [Dyella sp. OK004]|uniref:DUF2867 domain-containing protein n=1 Tax=Dyella sp. OK004 TaxID=1855292 RepID=UPI0008EEC05E|nr:DUF2867 domain-containing protein [Dyella sp. OK004]SFS17275.1 Protein of unknown function [Dyella sp. OK004]